MNHSNGDAFTFSIDSKVFLAAALAGATLLILSKFLNIPQLIITLLMVCVVLSYSVAVVIVGRLRLRLDQAGDNAYYLGLIFTLLSMAWALWEVGRAVRLQEDGPVSVAELVIGDFGLALGTTLVGIVCRIVLHQMRIDPADVESASRAELAQAASGMVSEIKNLTNSFGEFVGRLQQKHQDHIDELVGTNKEILDELVNHVTGAASQSTKLLQQTTDSVSNSISSLEHSAEKTAKILDDAVAGLTSIEPPPTKLSRSFSNLVTKVDAIAAALSESSIVFESSVDRLSIASSQIQKVITDLNSVPTTVTDRLSAQDRRFVTVVEQLNAALTSLSELIKGIEGSYVVIQDGSKRTVEAVRVAEESAVEVLNRLTSVVTKVDGAIESTAGSSNETPT